MISVGPRQREVKGDQFIQGITAQDQDGDADANHIEIVQDAQGCRLTADGEPFEV
jgi:hypothetical protein